MQPIAHPLPQVMLYIDDIEAIFSVIGHGPHLCVLDKVVEALLIVVERLDLDTALFLAFLVGSVLFSFFFNFTIKAIVFIRAFIDIINYIGL